MPPGRNMKPKIKISDLLIHLAVAALIFFSFYKGLQAAKNVDWVFDKDMVRNISMAQSMIDGHPLADSIFRGETIWYNPMLPALTAAVSKVTGSSLMSVNMRIGAYINLIVPIGFYLLLLFAFNIRTAALATAAMLFALNNTIPTYMAGTYSAVSYALHLAPGFFFLSMLFYIKGRQSERFFWYILCGVMLGFAFLTHTTPALILGAVITIDFLSQILKKPLKKIFDQDRRKIIYNFLAVVFVSMLVSGPLLYSILFKYHLKVINHSPARVIETILRARNFSLFIRMITPAIIILAAMLAGIILIILKLKEIAPRLIFITALIVLFFIGLSYLTQIAPPELHLPQVVPGLHYIQYLGFLEAVFFGIGAGFIVELLAVYLSKAIKKIKPFVKIENKLPLALQTVIILAMVCILFFSYKTEYLDRGDFTKFKYVATKHNKGLLRMNDWLAANIAPEDVMLDDDGLPAGIMMAARKMITNPAGDAASNSFVDYMARWKDHNDMIAALENKDYRTLQKLFKEYDVKYILESAGSNRKYWGSPAFLNEIHEHKQIAVFNVDYGRLNQLAAENPSDFSNNPFSVFQDPNLSMIVSIFQLELWNFNYLEEAALGRAITEKNIRWLNNGKERLNLEKALATMRCSSVLIARRKELMELAQSGKLDRLNRRDLKFCNLSPTREFIKIDRVYPQKVIIYCAQTEFAKEIERSNADIFNIRDLTTIYENKSLDDNSFINRAALMVFNSKIYKKYARDMKNGLEQKTLTRKQLLESFLKQASGITY